MDAIKIINMALARVGVATEEDTMTKKLGTKKTKKLKMTPLRKAQAIIEQQKLIIQSERNNRKMAEADAAVLRKIRDDIKAIPELAEPQALQRAIGKIQGRVEAALESKPWLVHWGEVAVDMASGPDCTASVGMMFYRDEELKSTKSR